jgi:hypothetical protein
MFFMVVPFLALATDVGVFPSLSADSDVFGIRYRYRRADAPDRDQYDRTAILPGLGRGRT